MSDCQDRCRELLPEYARDLLEPGEAGKVEDHLADCPDCNSELEVIRRLEDEIPTEPPPWFFSSLPGKVTAQVEERRRRKKRWLLPVWAGGAAAAAVAVVLFLQVGPEPQRGIDVPDYSLVQMDEPVPLGIEEEFLSVSGAYIEDLDQTIGLDLEPVSEDLMATTDLILEGDGYETMDEDAMRIFEDLIEKMTPEGVRKRVIS